MNKFNTADYSASNVSTTTLPELRVALSSMLLKLAECQLSNYSFEGNKFTLNNFKYIEIDEQTFYIKNEVSKMTEKDTKRHFKTIVKNAFLNLLNYEECTFFKKHSHLYNGNQKSNATQILLNYPKPKNYIFMEESFKILDIFFDYYGFIGEAGFKININSKTESLNNNTISLSPITINQFLNFFHNNFDDYPLLQKTIENVNNNQELFSFIESSSNFLFSIKNLNFYLDYLEQSHLSSEEKSESFEKLLKKTLKYPKILNEINCSKPTLEKINHLIGTNEELFKLAHEKIPSLSKFFNIFELSPKSFIEPDYSKVVYYKPKAIAKELSLFNKDYCIIKNIINTIFDQFSKNIDNHGINIEMSKSNINTNKIALIISGQDSKLVNTYYQKFDKLLNSILQEIFISNSINIINVSSTVRTQSLNSYITIKCNEFDLSEKTPININTYKALKF